MLDQATSPQKSHKLLGLRGKRILVVEDDPVVAIAYRYQLRAVGAEAVAYGSTVAAALKCMVDHPIDAAIVDYRLRDGPSGLLMQWLSKHQIPFIVVSGWPEQLPLSSSRIPILEKPVAADDLCAALVAVLY